MTLGTQPLALPRPVNGSEGDDPERRAFAEFTSPVKNVRARATLRLAGRTGAKLVAQHFPGRTLRKLGDEFDPAWLGPAGKARS